MTSITYQMSVIHDLDAQASICFNQVAETWYVRAPGIEILMDDALVTYSPHGRTPNEAVKRYFKAITNQVVVTGAFTNHRKEWTWNPWNQVWVRYEPKQEGT